MLLVGSALKGYTVEANDGPMGTVADLLFDDRTWKIRWLVVDTGTWLTGRKVLVHPSAIGQVDYERQEVTACLTRAQVKSSPDIRQDEPVSQQAQSRVYDHYGWDPVWGGSIFGAGAMSQAFYPWPNGDEVTAREAAGVDSTIDEGDPDLRSIAAVKGYRIHAGDGAIGHVENMLIDDASWDIRYLIIDTRNWWPGQHVLISPHAVKAISWTDRRITLDVTRGQVKTSPAWNPADIVDRAYEQRLHSHYAWPGYGW
jgi:hypothetical protein